MSIPKTILREKEKHRQQENYFNAIDKILATVKMSRDKRFKIGILLEKLRNLWDLKISLLRLKWNFTPKVKFCGTGATLFQKNFTFEVKLQLLQLLQLSEKSCTFEAKVKFHKKGLKISLWPQKCNSHIWIKTCGLNIKKTKTSWGILCISRHWNSITPGKRQNLKTSHRSFGWQSDRSDLWCSNIVPGLIRMIIPWSSSSWLYDTVFSGTIFFFVLEPFNSVL